MSDKENPLAPGGVIDPEQDINYDSNPHVDIDRQPRLTQGQPDSSESNSRVNAKITRIEASKLDLEPLAPSGFIDPTKDLQSQLHFLDNTILNYTNSIIGGVGVSFGDVQDATALLNQGSVQNALIKLGKDLGMGAGAIAGGLLTTAAIGVQRTITEAVDLAITKNNKYSSFNKNGDVIPVTDVGKDPGLELIDKNKYSPSVKLEEDLDIKFKVPDVDENFLDSINIYTSQGPYAPKKMKNRPVGVGSDSKAIITLKEINDYEKNLPDKQRSTDASPRPFEQKNVSLGKTSPKTWVAKTNARNRTASENRFGSKLETSIFLDGVMDMGFPQEIVEDNNSSLKVPAGKSPSDIIKDDEAYVPLTFTDLRPLTGESQRFRTIYFRPIITSLTEDLVPEYNKETYFGRSDQVVHYISTMRNLFINFELHAFSRRDVDIMYRKLNWLMSMVYPQYDKELLMKSGPVCRVRVGDVFSGINKQGLSGVIDSLNIDYADSIWELDENSKVPRTIRVSVSFHVLHDNIIGRNEAGDFGGLGQVDSNGKFSTKDFAENGTVDTRYFRGFGDLKKRPIKEEGLALEDEDFNG